MRRKAWLNCLVPAALMAALAPATGALGAAALAPPGADADAPVATVGGTNIKAGALERELRASRASTPAERRAALERLIRFELLYAAALRDGLDKRPDVAEAARRLVVGALVRERLEPRVAALQVTEQEIAAYFAEHQADFAVAAAVRAAVIQVKVPPRASPQKRDALRARAEAARAEALALPAGTPSLGSVAVRYSEDQATRYRGGDIGWLVQDRNDARWDREVVAAAFALRVPGEVGPLVESASGFHVVKLIESRSRAARPLSEVREQVRTLVLSAKKAQLEREFFAEISALTPVSVDEAALAAVPLAPAESTQSPPGLPGQ